VSYFRPQKARKTGPRSISGLPDSTQKLSRKGGRVKTCKCAQIICATLGVHPTKLGTTTAEYGLKPSIKRMLRHASQQILSSYRTLLPRHHSLLSLEEEVLAKK
jgi:hypothetical protein